MEKLSKREVAKIIFKYQGKKKGYLLSLLQDIQQKYNYLPPEVLEFASRKLSVSRSKIYGLATFYAQFSLTERGKYIIKVCEGTACHVKNSANVKERIKEFLGLENDGTTSDKKFTLETVACLGTCFLAPVMMVDSAYYGELDPGQAITILKELK
ncbi:MAG: NAD(P)H-dependent oxidoreductase subunit E [Candidatus Omnitrophica bacterium]|nr:NAD(P)H-dependent oxidoreductase subunit E [Candidatus Omnitrophota bacterium]